MLAGKNSLRQKILQHFENKKTGSTPFEIMASLNVLNVTNPFFMFCVNQLVQYNGLVSMIVRLGQYNGLMDYNDKF